MDHDADRIPCEGCQDLEMLQLLLIFLNSYRDMFHKFKLRGILNDICMYIRIHIIYTYYIHIHIIYMDFVIIRIWNIHLFSVNTHIIHILYLYAHILYILYTQYILYLYLYIIIFTNELISKQPWGQPGYLRCRSSPGAMVCLGPAVQVRARLDHQVTHQSLGNPW